MTDNIIIPRVTVQQALEALEGLFGLPNQWESGGVAVWRLGGSSEPRKAITALKAALEQQAEPVQERITHITWDERGVRTVNGIPDDAPQRKSLAASEILNMMPSGIPAEYDGELMEFARAVEAKLKERNT